MTNNSVIQLSQQSAGSTLQTARKVEVKPDAVTQLQQQVVLAETSVAAQTEQPEKEQHQSFIEDNVSKINDYVQNFQRNLKFEVSEDGSHTVIYVINAETDEVIRQIPPEELEAISTYIQSLSTEGLLFNAKI